MYNNFINILPAIQTIPKWNRKKKVRFQNGIDTEYYIYNI